MRGRLGGAVLLSDDRLARRAAKGDERAFAAIFDRYHQPLYRFCLAIVGSPADAQDALQNTMVKVLGALPGERRQIELKPWLYRIAHNESVELLRRRRPTEALDPELATRGRGLAEDAESRERLRHLIADLERLPERQRGTLVMRELSGLDFEEIATALGTSPAVARQTLYEARQSLRQMDEGREMDCASVTKALSDADGRVTRRRDIRAHLRSCSDCRRFRDEIAGRRDDLGALAPLPAVAAAGLLQGLIGGAGASGGAGAGMAGAAAGGAAKTLGAGAAIKSAAAVAVVAAVGVGAADRGGVVDVTPWDGGSQQRQGDSEAGGGATPPESAGSQAGGSGSEAVNSPAALGESAPAGMGDQKAEKGAGVGPAGGNGDPSAAPGSAAATRGSGGGSHPRGRGHEKRHPDAASYGQQKAASHKASGKGGGQGRGGGADKGQPTKQAKSPRQTKPNKPTRSVVPTKPSETAPSDKGVVSAPPKAPTDPGAAAPPHPNPSPRADEGQGSSAPPEAEAHDE